MKILLMPHMFLPRIGGVEIVCSNLAEALRDEGHFVYIVTSKMPKYLPLNQNWNGIKIVRLPFRYPGKTLKANLSFMVNGLFSIIALSYIICKYRFDVINLHFISHNAVYLLLCSYFSKSAIVTSIHGSDVMDFITKNKIIERLSCGIIKRSKFISSNSKYLGNTLQNKLHIEIEDKLKIIPNGIYIGRTSKPIKIDYDYNSYILSVGRLNPVKGYDILIKAFNAAKNKINDLKLVIIGDGPERENLEALISRYNLDNRIFLLGRQNHEIVIEYMKKCYCYVTCSRKEAFGLTNIEAMSLGKLVVSSKVGGISEYITHNENGILFKTNSVKDLKEILIDLCKNEYNIDTIRNAGKKFAIEKYDLNIIFMKYKALYDLCV